MTRARTSIATAIASIASLLLAGCASPLLGAEAAEAEPATIPEDWYRLALPHDAGHNHGSREEHDGLSTPNFELLGWNHLPTNAYGGAPAGGYGCGESAQRHDGTRLSLVHVFGNSRVAFVLADVTDPANPVKIGEFSMRGVGGYDAALTRDARHAVLGFGALARQPGVAAASEPAVPVLSWRACGAAEEQLIPLPDALVTSGIVLIDVQDPARPTLADYDPTPGVNLHSVSTAADGDDQWVTASVVNLAHPASYFVFDRVVETPAGAKLVRTATVPSPPISATLDGGARWTLPTWNGHVDATMQRHPVDGRFYAYLSDWDGGVVTVDLTVPAAPVIVSTWFPPGGGTIRSPSSSCWDYAIHEVLPIEGTWEGRHYLFAGQECPYKPRPGVRGGSVYLIDNTDPIAPTLVSEWHLPEDTGEWTMTYQASPHYVALHNRTLFVSAYHAGLWAVDYTQVTEPAAIGAYVPTMAPPRTPATGGPAPFTWQVEAYPDGVLVLHDYTSGLYTLRFDASNPAPRALPFPTG